MNQNYGQRNLLGHFIAPLVGILSVLIIGGLLILLDNKENKIYDGPTFEGNSIIIGFFFCLCFCAYLFQFIIIRPYYNYLESKKRLKKGTIIRAGFILTIVFALLNYIPLIEANMNFKSFGLEMLFNLTLWSSYFLMNSLTYFYINKEKITTANTGA